MIWLSSRVATRAFLAFVVLAATGAVGAFAALSVSPRTLYQDLLRKPFAKDALMSGSPLVKPTVGKLGKVARRYHAIGEVDVAFNDIKDGISYIVYPTSADARTSWLANRRPGVIKVATPGLPQPVRVSAQGGGQLAIVSFATGNVIIGSFARSQSKNRSVLAAIALAQAALSRLRAIEHRSS